jgi:TonB family protein
MPKPLRSEIRNPPNRQFAHFGVLDSGGQSKSAFFGSIVFNVILALLAIIIGASVKKQIDTRKKLELTYAEIKPIPKPEPPKPKIVPPKPPPPKIEPPKIEPPKIKLPDVKVVEPPKPVPVPIVQPKMQPVIMPAAPKVLAAAAAPKPVSVNMPAQSAALKNNSSAPPAPVALGRQDSPVPTNLTGPAVSKIRLNAGMSGMPPGSGVGKPSAVTLAGNGAPGGKIGGTAVAAVAGIPHGIVGGTGTNGNGTGTQVRQVAMGVPPPPPPSSAPRVVAATASHGPQVTFKPKPIYTAEATAAHVEGSVVVNIKVSPTGAVTVVGVAKGLGHGLDESARQCAAAIRFKPATDAAGNAIEWEGPVTITFQMA